VSFGFVATSTAASGPSWTDVVTAVGTVLAGLALPLAFVQLGALRRDQLREQVGKVGAWTGTPEQQDDTPALPVNGRPSWSIPVRVRNGSDLPVQVDAVDLVIQPWGYMLTQPPKPTRGVEYPVQKKTGDSNPDHFTPGTVAPGDTWSGTSKSYYAEGQFDQPNPPMASVIRVVVTDAAGYQWEIRSAKPGPARRVRQWRRRWWKRHGDL
jgi:hypothetical protein